MDTKEPWQVDDDKSQTSQYKEGVGYPEDPIDPAYAGGGPRGPKGGGFAAKNGQGVQVHIERQTHNDDYGARPY